MESEYVKDGILDLDDDDDDNEYYTPPLKIMLLY